MVGLRSEAGAMCVQSRSAECSLSPKRLVCVCVPNSVSKNLAEAYKGR